LTLNLFNPQVVIVVEGLVEYTFGVGINSSISTKSKVTNQLNRSTKMKEGLITKSKTPTSLSFNTTITTDK
jgi:hypothetical protein